jgi:phage terminase small subunit
VAAGEGTRGPVASPEPGEASKWAPPGAVALPGRSEVPAAAEGEWLPPGHEPAAARDERPRERRASRVMPALDGAGAAASVTGAVPDSATPAADELRERLATLERQIADAQSSAAALERRRDTEGAPSALEVDNVKTAYLSLQQAVQELRGRVDHQGGLQRETIASLEERLDGFERALRSPLAGHPPPSGWLSSLAWVVASAAVVVVIAGSPLFALYRSKCSVGGHFDTHWSFVVPFAGHPPKECRNESGARILLDGVGLK